jgi:hypothetical protein
MFIFFANKKPLVNERRDRQNQDLLMACGTILNPVPINFILNCMMV